jgi:hypothetical protein
MKTKIADRLVALALVVPFFFTTSCPGISGSQETDNTVTYPAITLPDVPETPKIPPKPLVFYLDGQYRPVMEDTGRTGFTVMYGMPDESVLLSSEDTGGDPIVRIMTVSQQEGEMSLVDTFFYFHNQDSPFPYRCSVAREYEGVTFEQVDVSFSDYNETTESFSVAYSGTTFDNLVLNKGVFSAYTADPSLSKSKNIRMRNAITALALWTALEIQGTERGLAAAFPRYEINEFGAYIYQAKGAKEALGWVFVGIAVVALTVAVIACPPASIAIVSTVGGISLTVTAGVSTATGAIAAGVAMASAGAAALIWALPDPPVPESPHYITGDYGQGGGTLIDKRHSHFDFDMEILPYRADTNLMYNQAAALPSQPNFNSITGWRLPTHDELFTIYFLYLVQGLIGLNRISPLSHEEGNFIWTSTETDSNHVMVLVLSVQNRENGSGFNENFDQIRKTVRAGAIYVREIR